MVQCLVDYIKQESGATAIEYTLIAAGIAVAISASVYLVGGDVLAFFNAVHAEF